jgi:hypothetical protein
MLVYYQKKEKKERLLFEQLEESLLTASPEDEEALVAQINKQSLQIRIVNMQIELIGLRTTDEANPSSETKLQIQRATLEIEILQLKIRYENAAPEERRMEIGPSIITKETLLHDLNVQLQGEVRGVKGIPLFTSPSKLTSLAPFLCLSLSASVSLSLSLFSLQQHQNQLSSYLDRS